MLISSKVYLEMCKTILELRELNNKAYSSEYVQKLEHKFDEICNIAGEVIDECICNCYDEYGKLRPNSPCVICRLKEML